MTVNIEARTVGRPQQFSRAARLLCEAEFKNVFKNGRKISTVAVWMRYTDNHRAQARLGIVAAKHCLPKAVDRNAFKRLAREQFRKLQHTLRACDMVICTPSQPVKLSRHQWSAQLRELLAKAPKLK